MNSTKKTLRVANKSTEFLESSIANHQRRFDSAIKSLEDKIILETKNFRLGKGGKLVGPRVNLKLAQKVHSQLDTLFDATYGDAARQVTRGFKTAGAFVRKSFKELGFVADYTGVDKDVLKALQQNTWNTFNQFGLATQEKLVDSMYSSILGNLPYTQLVDDVRGLLSGFEGKTGNMARYADLYASDATMNFHTEVTLKKATDIGISNFLYYGNVMKTTRPFCRERVGNVYSKEEIEGWDALSWQGQSGPAMTNRGGYNCRHSWVPVKLSEIDEAELEKAKPEVPVKKKVEDPKVRFDDKVLKRRNTEMATKYFDDAEAVRRFEKDLQQTFDKSSIFIRQEASSVEKILDAGRFKTQFEVHASGGLLDTEYRQIMEKKLFKYPKTLDDKLRPVYGTLTGDKFNIGGTVEIYGNTSIKLKNRVKKYATWTADDSLGAVGKDTIFAPSPVTNPKVGSFARYEAMTNPDTGLSITGIGEQTNRVLNVATKHIDGTIDGIPNFIKASPRTSYVEVQLHGGVSANDIESILYHNPYVEKKNLPSEKVLNWAKKNDVELLVEHSGEYRKFEDIPF